MAFSQNERFALLPQLVSDISKPLSHPARVKIVMHLLKHGDTPFQELLKVIPLHQTTVSQHLRLLKRNQLVDVYEKTPHTIYSLNFEQFRKLIMIMQEFIQQLMDQGIDPKDTIIRLEE